MICERNHVIGAGSSDEILSSLEDDGRAGNGSASADLEFNSSGGGGRPSALNLSGGNGVYASHYDNGTSLCRCGSKEGITDFMDTVERVSDTIEQALTLKAEKT